MRSYESPKIVELGTLADLTAAQVPLGAELDADFPSGTPFADLRWTN